MISLLIVRRMRLLGRKWFGSPLPHWIADPFTAINYLKTFSIIPTIELILFHPKHFLKVLPAIVDQRRSAKPYVTPFYFLINLAILQVLAILFIEDHSRILSPWLSDETLKELLPNSWIERFHFIFINACLALLAPISIPVACIIILFIRQLGMVRPLHVLTREIPFNHFGVLIPLAPSTYTSLNWRIYSWAMAYYYLYFYVMMLVVGALFAGIAIPLGMFLLSNWHNTIAIQIAAAIASVAGAWIGYVAFVRPYARLLIGCSLKPTELMERYIWREFELGGPSPLQAR